MGVPDLLRGRCGGASGARVRGAGRVGAAVTEAQGTDVVNLLRALLLVAGAVGIGGVFLLAALAVRELLRGG